MVLGGPTMVLGGPTCLLKAGGGDVSTKSPTEAFPAEWGNLCISLV